MSTIIESIEQRQLKKVPRFEPGDRVRVHFQVIEGTRRRTQVFEGIVDFQVAVSRDDRRPQKTFARDPDERGGMRTAHLPLC
jgi:ribosomal protein L19